MFAAVEQLICFCYGYFSNSPSFPFDLKIRLLNQWKESCDVNNIVLPAKAIAELKKRIKQSETHFDEGKSKLNLSNCMLDDKTVSL